VACDERSFRSLGKQERVKIQSNGGSHNKKTTRKLRRKGVKKRARGGICRGNGGPLTLRKGI